MAGQRGLSPTLNLTLHSQQQAAQQWHDLSQAPPLPSPLPPPPPAAAGRGLQAVVAKPTVWPFRFLRAWVPARFGCRQVRWRRGARYSSIFLQPPPAFSAVQCSSCVQNAEAGTARNRHGGKARGHVSAAHSRCRRDREEGGARDRGGGYRSKGIKEISAYRGAYMLDGWAKP